jgi:hypothetical protein
MSFQSTINVYNTIGFPGDIAFASPMVVQEYNLYHATMPLNFGYAYTVTDGGHPNPAGDSPLGANATVGGTGIFAGILVNRQEAVLNGTTSGPLNASLALLNYAEGSLMTSGFCVVSLPGPAALGDLVTFDALTGALNSTPPLAKFTGAIAAGGSAGVPDVLTVTLMAAGTLGVGSIISGAGVETATILSLGSGLGGNGTYNISTINQQTVSAVAMTAPNLPPAAFVGLASFATNVMTVNTATSGELVIGQQIFGSTVPANTVITAFGTGAGGTGTYTLNNTTGTITNRAITAPANTVIPNATVREFTPNAAGGGVAVIKL